MALLTHGLLCRCRLLFVPDPKPSRPKDILNVCSQNTVSNPQQPTVLHDPFELVIGEIGLAYCYLLIMILADSDLDKEQKECSI